MARITIEDCLKRIPNRFTLVGMVAKRVRQIREGSDLLVSSPKNEDIVIALREVAAGKITIGAPQAAAPEGEPESAAAAPQEAEPAPADAPDVA
jgi:DNA-directed RNA polymerase subunit omega